MYINKMDLPISIQCRGYCIEWLRADSDRIFSHLLRIGLLFVLLSIPLASSHPEASADFVETRVKSMRLSFRSVQ